MTSPSSVTVRMYNVGFGDCFGLAFHYPDGSGVATKHVVIDCGSVALPRSKDKPRYSLKKVAEDIKTWCGGDLDAIVATHRHQDHLAGFGGSAGDVFASMQPKLVVQPWTEDPALPVDAHAPLPGGLTDHQAFTTALAGQQNFVEAALASLAALDDGEPSTALGYLGQNNISNRKAVENLMAMGSAGDAEYVSHDQDSKLNALLPGVTVHVLGPPTIKEWKRITRQRSEDEVEFWHLVGANADGTQVTGDAALLDHRTFTKNLDRVPVSARWAVERFDDVNEDLLLPILRRLDDELNNTSLILLFEVGDGAHRKLLLFPGDAQIENWEQVFEGPQAAKWVALLSEVDFYKVGHHGSLNATPKDSLWELFGKLGAEGDSGRMISMLSSRGNVHGHHRRETEVPRRKLVDALDDRSDLLQSTFTHYSKMFREVTLDVGP